LGIFGNAWGIFGNRKDDEGGSETPSTPPQRPRPIAPGEVAATGPSSPLGSPGGLTTQTDDNSSSQAQPTAMSPA
jgi:hypothetical protein